MKPLIACFAAILTISAANAAEYGLSGSMDVLQAGTNGGFGAGTGNGTGTIFGSYDDTTNFLNYNVSWADLTAPVTNMHFHNAPVGVSGGVDLGIPGPWTSPEIGTDILLSASQETNLLAGNWYVNVHTANFGGGEIRGQVSVTPVPEPSALAMLSLGGVAVLGWSRRQRRIRANARIK